MYNEDMQAIDRIGGMTHSLTKRIKSKCNIFTFSTVGVQGLLSKLKTSIDKGLDPTDFTKREE